MSKKISEIDVTELIKSKGGKDFLIDVSLDENNKILSILLVTIILKGED